MPPENIYSNTNPPSFCSIFSHVPGKPARCLCVSLTIEKMPPPNRMGNNIVSPSVEDYKVGMRIGGGIDQDPGKSPYNDTGVYVTGVEPGSPADLAGIRVDDKILQVNGKDFTMLTHQKAVQYLKRDRVLQVLVARAELAN